MRVSYDYMGDRTAPIGDDTELLARFKGDAREIPSKFLRNNFVGGNPTAIDLLKKLEKAFFKAFGISVNRRYLDNLIPLILTDGTILDKIPKVGKMNTEFNFEKEETWATRRSRLRR